MQENQSGTKGSTVRDKLKKKKKINAPIEISMFLYEQCKFLDEEDKIPLNER